MRDFRGSVCLLAAAAVTMVFAAPAQAATAATTTKARAAAVSAQHWNPCGFRDDRLKKVRVFTRYGATAAGGKFLRGGSSDLHCGSKNWGYRHILDRHLDDWSGYASYTKENWRDLADVSIAAALTDPDRVLYRSSNDTFGFQRQIYLVNKNDGRTVGTITTCTVVARVTVNIITSYPGACR